MNSGKAFGLLKTEIEDDSSDINYIRSKFAWPIFVINQICSKFFVNYTQTNFFVIKCDDIKTGL